jgi:poly-gamma-glutamate capsule biosynthesis protein CapA/YwtB (metallophosphatase superfamily)
MEMKITQPFTMAAVGDVIIMRPMANSNDPALQSALRILQGADVAFGNFESIIRDQRTFDGPLGGSMTGTKEVAPDLVQQGFDLMSRAGNHLMDAGQEGMFETMRLMDEAGLVYAGAGRNLDEARAPRFVEVPKGRVGLVAMYGQTGGGNSRLSASYLDGVTGGRPGLNALNVTRIITVRPQDITAMRATKDAVYARLPEERNAQARPAADPANTVNLFGESYRGGDKPGELTYTMNGSDLEENLRAIRNGKQYSDFMIATIHAHQADNLLQRFLFEDRPPNFLIDLAHQAIDAGADAFVGHGPHILRGIEIYKGKPIFYDLGEFAREWDWSCDCNVNGDGDLTQAETVVAGHLARGVEDPVNYESVIAVSHFDRGQLQEVRLHPIWARHDGPISQRGMPMTAPPEIAQRILRRLQELSRPLGTTITIEGNEGVIRVGRATNNN